MKRIILAALVGVLVSGPGWNGHVAAAEIKDLAYFLNNFKGPDSAQFTVHCFQNGKSIILEKNLFIREIGGKMTIGNSFVDKTGNVVLLFLSSDTSCHIWQTKTSSFGRLKAK